MKLEKSCGVICYNYQFEILLLKHRSGNHYDFCKGHIEANETEQECAIREVKEETGLDIHLDNNFKVYACYNVLDRGFKQVCWFSAQVEGSVEIQETEIIEHQWVSIDRAMEMITYPTSREVLKAFTSWMTKL